MMEIVRSKKVLVSDFECCQKYRHTLPAHVELINASFPKASISSTSSIPVGHGLDMSDVPPCSSREGMDFNLTVSSSAITNMEPVLDQMQLINDTEDWVKDEDSESMSSICSEWIVLLPGKRKKRKKPEESVLLRDMDEPANTKRLLKRPPSPEGEVFNLDERPKQLIPSNFIKYKDVLQEWPEPPPLSDALLKRQPSPNASLPRSDRSLEIVPGEDWLWFEGRYVEGGICEWATGGEDGEYYRIAKQWKEGHWEPSPYLLEKWEKEEKETEREIQRMLEEKKTYDEILKREESPGMDIINWGDGPVKLIKWKQALQEPSIELLSGLLSEHLSIMFLDRSSELTSKDLKTMSSQLNEALTGHSVSIVRDIINNFLSDQLAQLISEEMQSKIEIKSDLINEGRETLEGARNNEEIVREWADSFANEDVIPEDFRNLLLTFFRSFLNDLPDDPLEYTINYFEYMKSLRDENYAENFVKSKTNSNYLLTTLSTRREAFAIAEIVPEVPPINFDYIDFKKTENQISFLCKILKELFLFKQLAVTTFSDIMKNIFQINVSQDDVIVEENEEVDCMYIIESGSFLVSKGFNEIFRLTPSCGYFGESSLISDTPSPYKITALNDGVLWCLPKETYRYLIALGNFERRTYITNLMNGLDLFKTVTEHEKNSLIDCVELRYFKKGEVVFCHRDKPEGLYFLLLGSVNLVTENEKKSKKKYQSVHVSSPAALGADNFVSNKSWRSSCVTSSNLTEIAVLRAEVFNRLVDDVENVLNRTVPLPYAGSSRKYIPIGDREELGEYEVGMEEEYEEFVPKPPRIKKLERLPPHPRLSLLSVKPPEEKDSDSSDADSPEKILKELFTVEKDKPDKNQETAEMMGHLVDLADTPCDVSNPCESNPCDGSIPCDCEVHADKPHHIFTLNF